MNAFHFDSIYLQLPDLRVDADFSSDGDRLLTLDQLLTAGVTHGIENSPLLLFRVRIPRVFSRLPSRSSQPIRLGPTSLRLVLSNFLSFMLCYHFFKIVDVPPFLFHPV